VSRSWSAEESWSAESVASPDDQPNSKPLPVDDPVSAVQATLEQRDRTTLADALVKPDAVQHLSVTCLTAGISG
jgi:hypothetical protein